MPERDASGNVIPAWKRQMLARRAAEKARRDLERELAGEAERRRAAAVPVWKRQLLQRREEAESRLRLVKLHFSNQFFLNVVKNMASEELKEFQLGTDTVY